MPLCTPESCTILATPAVTSSNCVRRSVLTESSLAGACRGLGAVVMDLLCLKERGTLWLDPPFAQNAKGGAPEKAKDDAALKAAALRKNQSAQPRVAVPQSPLR